MKSQERLILSGVTTIERLDVLSVGVLNTDRNNSIAYTALKALMIF